MVKQYLDVLTWNEKGTLPTTDQNGFPVPGTTGAEVTAKCRYENFSGKGVREFRNSDGEVVLQVGTVYVKRGEPIPIKFEKIKVTRDGIITFEGEALNVYTGQLNVTISV